MPPLHPQLALDWIAAWNSHELDRILAFYADEVLLVSPAAAKLLNEPSGIVAGLPALRAYFQRGLDAYPNLHFELIDVFSGLTSVVVVFKNQNGGRTAEYMEMRGGKISRVVANYAG